MRSFRGTLARRDACTHQDTVATAAAGIERLVCGLCGHVSIRDSENRKTHVTFDPTMVDAIEAQASTSKAS